MNLEQLSYPQRQRLIYIDFCLLFQGHVSRSQLLKQFEVGLSAATRDFNLYKQHAPNNLMYNNTSKQYHQNKQFSPLFEHDATKTLMELANQIGEDNNRIVNNRIANMRIANMGSAVEPCTPLNTPDLFTTARIVQAILNQQAVKVIYTSLTSGSNARELVPHSVIDNGTRWHVRAFDRKSNNFRDFVLTRISQVAILPVDVAAHELKTEDCQWHRIMHIQLVPHPKNIEYPTAIELDYGMSDGQLQLQVRAAMAGYLLRRFNVDCSGNASLRGAEYQLWLTNQQSLYGAENLAIAPGYQSHKI